IAPLGRVYQAGTLSGNPLAMIAGITTLKILKDNPSIYTELEEKTSYLHKGLHEVLSKKNLPFVINRFGSMISVHFTDHPVKDFESASAADMPRFNKFFHGMLEQGIYLPPSAFESWFLNNALSINDLDETIDAASSLTLNA
ncbi:MAG TPA: aminotransferase class III-fold pyridoxal phosphate-dependent enzyme, partial [Puia sp.]